MRERKYRAWNPDIKEMVYFDLVKASGDKHIAQQFLFLLSNTHDMGKDLLTEFTGLQDRNGVDIFEGDILNICFSSNGAEWLHDCVYRVTTGVLGGIEFDYVRLMWESFGHNQYPNHMTLCEKYKCLSTVYAGGRQYLIAGDESYTDAPLNDYPFNNERELSFSSRYIEVIGNIYENPELLDVAE